jgi:hypothetical protein
VLVGSGWFEANDALNIEINVVQIVDKVSKHTYSVSGGFSLVLFLLSSDCIHV